MTTNKEITVYRYKDGAEDYLPIFTGNASSYNEIKVSPDSSGQSNDNTLRIRIPTKDELDIRTGDYIMPKGIPFNRESAYKIIAICDNRRNSTPHYRIDAK
ncbi:MAG: hypothetical protein IJ007_00885 [Oscillospiraceae bacterium]|nr:hypothetical protein [Oscillospiraceae bacterium]